MSKKKTLFDTLQDRDNTTSTTKLNNDSVNKIVDVISQPVRRKKWEVNPEIPFLQQLADEQKKRGES